MQLQAPSSARLGAISKVPITPVAIPVRRYSSVLSQTAKPVSAGRQVTAQAAASKTAAVEEDAPAQTSSPSGSSNAERLGKDTAILLQGENGCR